MDALRKARRHPGEVHTSSHNTCRRREPPFVTTVAGQPGARLADARIQTAVAHDAPCGTLSVTELVVPRRPRRSPSTASIAERHRRTLLALAIRETFPGPAGRQATWRSSGADSEPRCFPRSVRRPHRRPASRAVGMNRLEARSRGVMSLATWLPSGTVRTRQSSCSSFGEGLQRLSRAVTRQPQSLLA